MRGICMPRALSCSLCLLRDEEEPPVMGKRRAFQEEDTACEKELRPGETQEAAGQHGAVGCGRQQPEGLLWPIT